MNQVTKQQITKIHVLLNQIGIMDYKAELVKQFSGGRETSSTKLTYNEARLLLTHLSQSDPLDKMRRKVFALAYDAGIIYGDSKDDRSMNIAKLNMFLKSRGTVKKELNRMNKAELVKVVNQFSLIVQHKGDAQVNKQTKSMLDELGITTI